MNTKHVIKDYNKKLEKVNEDMERTDVKMNNLTNRFKNYASGYSWCKMISILVLEIGISFFSFIFLFN